MKPSKHHAAFSFSLTRRDENSSCPSEPAPRVSRLARLLALAIQLDGLLASGEVINYAALARLGHVSRARLSQIMNLVHLAPDIQEDMLFLPPSQTARAAITFQHVQPITRILSWQKQRRLWRQLKRNLRLLR